MTDIESVLLFSWLSRQPRRLSVPDLHLRRLLLPEELPSVAMRVLNLKVVRVDGDLCENDLVLHPVAREVHRLDVVLAEALHVVEEALERHLQPDRRRHVEGPHAHQLVATAGSLDFVLLPEECLHLVPSTAQVPVAHKLLVRGLGEDGLDERLLVGLEPFFQSVEINLPGQLSTLGHLVRAVDEPLDALGCVAPVHLTLVLLIQRMACTYARFFLLVIFEARLLVDLPWREVLET